VRLCAERQTALPIRSVVQIINYIRIPAVVISTAVGRLLNTAVSENRTALAQRGALTLRLFGAYGYASDYRPGGASAGGMSANGVGYTVLCAPLLVLCALLLAWSCADSQPWRLSRADNYSLASKPINSLFDRMALRARMGSSAVAADDDDSPHLRTAAGRKVAGSAAGARI
jgi:hypothetical protein